MVSLHLDTARTWRGGQQQALLTVEGLRARGHRTLLVAPPDGELFRRAPDTPDRIGLSASSEIDLTAAWRLSRLLATHRPDVVHAHDSHGLAIAATALSFGAAAPAPQLIASRRVDFHLNRNSFSRWKHRQVAQFIAASQAIADMLYTDGIGRDRISVVHDGIDVERIGRIAPIDVHQEFWLPHGVPVLVNIGALVDHKGQRYLLDALPLAMRRIPDLHLVILGEGELRRPLEQQVQRLHLERAVRMPGFRSDVLALARSADLFVMSSVTEGLGSTVLDAMAMGLAVVGTRAGGIPEAVVDGETGLLIPVADPPALADAIVSLMNDPARRARFGDAGRQRVARHFTVDHLVERTFAVYQEVVSRAARVTPRG